MIENNSNFLQRLRKKEEENMDIPIIIWQAKKM
jgi:hypothetical protein